MILVDTSVWVEVFRRERPLDLERVVDFDDVVTCPPIVQEVLQGIRDIGPMRVAEESMLALPIVESPMELRTWLEAAQLYRVARAAGVTIRSAVDCLIGACALRLDLEVLHRDRDFTGLARVSALRQRQPQPR
jgi:predicted nucleic acid-binding protein